MMGVTHRPFGAAWWLGGVLAANTIGAGINPVVALGGAAIAPVFAAGRLSPDADMTWLKRLGHRQATHRPDTTAVTITAVTAALWVTAFTVGVPFGVAAIAWAPAAGWWSHLAGDALFGRIPVGPALGAALARVLPARWVRHTPGGRQAYWVGAGWDTDGILERGNHRSDTRDPRTGLRTTRRVLPFAPTTAACRAAVVVLACAVTVQALTGAAT